MLKLTVNNDSYSFFKNNLKKALDELDSQDLIYILEAEEPVSLEYSFFDPNYTMPTEKTTANYEYTIDYESNPSIRIMPDILDDFSSFVKAEILEDGEILKKIRAETNYEESTHNEDVFMNALALFATEYLISDQFDTFKNDYLFDNYEDEAYEGYLEELEIKKERDEYFW